MQFLWALFEKREFKSGVKTIVAFGAVFGLVSGATAGTGMFVIAGLNSAGLRGAVLLGTDAIIGFVNGTMRAGVYSALGLLTTDDSIRAFDGRPYCSW